MAVQMADHFLIPDWPVPAGVKSAITLRSGGCSSAPFDSNNLAMHVEDCQADVQSNRNNLVETLALPTQPLWLDQCHGTDLVYVPDYLQEPQQPATADGSYSDQAGYGLRHSNRRLPASTFLQSIWQPRLPPPMPVGADSAPAY